MSLWVSVMCVLICCVFSHRRQLEKAALFLDSVLSLLLLLLLLPLLLPLLLLLLLVSGWGVRGEDGRGGGGEDAVSGHTQQMRVKMNQRTKRTKTEMRCV